MKAFYVEFAYDASYGTEVEAETQEEAAELVRKEAEQKMGIPAERWRVVVIQNVKRFEQ